MSSFAADQAARDEINALRARVEQLERRLAALDGQAAAPGFHDGTVGGPESDPQLLGLLRAGNKLEAVKRYRLLTGVGLKEALDAVERL